ncbi:hypothetical protein C922_01084 [Plasmodium inui San Antonio 1]|uniref:K Homology domain-containing protein n=1 Tax=Plasmodium inui San Antonio 1 TaxID=1237626 RepID=W7AI49_9APIC|nr:hypothetical protein C922_01084 [Plasmodium inui San Antonio 1]EUD68684.1 hypothetical protein C922_01084 [Plasmodium inui San Antonio 1]
MDADYRSEQPNVPQLVRQMDLNNVPLKGSNKDKKDKKDKTERTDKKENKENKENKEKKEKKEKRKTKSKTASQQMDTENVNLYNSQRGGLSLDNCKFIASDVSRMTNEVNKSAVMDSSNPYRCNIAATFANKNNESNGENTLMRDVQLGKNNFVNQTVCNVEETKEETPFSGACLIRNFNSTMERPGYSLLNNSLGGKNNFKENISAGASMSTIISDCYSGGVNRRGSAINAGDNCNYREGGGLYLPTSGGNPSCNLVSGVNSMHNLNSGIPASEHRHTGFNSYADGVYEGVSTTSSNVKCSSWKSIAQMSNTNMVGLTKRGETSNANSAPMQDGSSKKKTKTVDDLGNEEVAIKPEKLFANFKRLNVDEMRKDDDVVREKNTMELLHYDNLSFNDGMCNLLGRGTNHYAKSVQDNCGIITPTVTTTMTPMMTGTSNSANGNRNRMKNNVAVTQSESVATPRGDDLHLADAMSNNTSYEDYTKMSSSVTCDQTSDLKKYILPPITSNSKGNGKGSLYTPFLSNNQHEKVLNGNAWEGASNYIPKENVEDGPVSSGAYANVGNDSRVIDEKKFKGKNLIKGQILNYTSHAQHDNQVQHGSHAVESSQVSYNQSAFDTSKVSLPMMGQQKNGEKNQSEDLKFIKKDRFFFRNGDSLFKGDMHDELPELVNPNFKGANACSGKNVKSVKNVKPGYMATDSTLYTANNFLIKNKNGGEEDDDLDENGQYFNNENSDHLSRRCGDGATGPFNFESEAYKNCESVIGPYNYDEEMHLNYEDDLQLNYDDDLLSKNPLHLDMEHLNVEHLDVEHLEMKHDDIGNASYFEKSYDFEENVAQLEKDLDFSANLSSMSKDMSFLNFDDSEEKDWKYEYMNEIFSAKGNPYLGSDDPHSFYGRGTLRNSLHFNHGIGSSRYNLGAGRSFGLSACSTVFPSPVYSTPTNWDEKSSFAAAVQSSNQCSDGMRKNVNNNMLFVDNSNLSMHWGNAHSGKLEKCANVDSACGRNNDTINSHLICEENNVCHNDHTLMDENHLGLPHDDHSLENNSTSLGNSKNLIHSVCMNMTSPSASESIFACSKCKGVHRRNELEDETGSVLHADGEHMEKKHSRGSYCSAMTKKGAELGGKKCGIVHSSGISRKVSMNRQGVNDNTFEDSTQRGGSSAKGNEQTNPDGHISADATGESLTGKCRKNYNRGISNNKSSVTVVGIVQSSRPRESATDQRSVRNFSTNDPITSISSSEHVQLKNASIFSNDSTNSTSRSRSDGSNRNNRSNRSNPSNGSNRSNRTCRDDPINSNGRNQSSINPVVSEMNKNDNQNNGLVNAGYRNKLILAQHNSQPLSYEHIKSDNYTFKSEMVSNDKSKSNAFSNFASTNLANTNSNGCTNNVLLNSRFNEHGKDKNNVMKYFQSGLKDGSTNVSTTQYDNNSLIVNRNTFDSHPCASHLNSANALNLNPTFLNPSTCNNAVYHAINEKNESFFLLITNNPLEGTQRINLLISEKGKIDIGGSPLLTFNKQNLRSGHSLKNDQLGAIQGSMSSKPNDDMFHLSGEVDNFGGDNQSGMYRHPMDPGENVYRSMSNQNVYLDMNKLENGIYKNGTNLENLVDQVNNPNDRCSYHGNIKSLHGDDNTANVNLIGKNEYLFRNIEEDIHNEVNHVQEGEVKYGSLSGALHSGASIGVGMIIPPGLVPTNCPYNNAKICDNLVSSDHLNNLADSMNRFGNDVDFILDENEDLEIHSKASLKDDKIIELQNIINSLKFKNKQLEKELTEVKNMQLKKKQNLILNSLSNKNDDISSYSTYKDDTNNSDCGSADNANRYIQNILNDKEKYNYDTKISIQKFHLAYTNNSIGKLKIAAQRDISGSFMGPKGIHVKTIKSSLHISVYKSAKDVWFPGFADSHVFLLKGNIFGILRACQLLYHYVKSKMSSSKCCIYLVAPFECVQKLLADGCKRMAIIKEECGADVRLGNLYVQVHEGFTERLMEIRGNEVSVDCALEKLVIFMQSCFSVQSYDYELLKYPCRSVLNLQ